MTASSPQMLPSLWAVRDVADVEMLCRGALAEQLRRTNVDPSPTDYDEALAYLLGEVVVLEQRFEERPGIQFRPWLYSMLRRRVIDYWRSWYGRNGQHRIIDQRPAEQGRADRLEAIGSSDGIVDTDGPRPDRLDGAVARGEGGSPEDWPDAVRGLLGERDSAVARAERRLGFGPDPNPPGRDHGADIKPARRNGSQPASAHREASEGYLAA